MSYRKGRGFEYEVRDLMSKNGWLVVRAARSKPVDLVCIKSGKVVLIECKYGNYISKKERDNLRRMAKRYGAIAVLAYRFKGKKKISMIDLMVNKEFRFYRRR